MAVSFVNVEKVTDYIYTARQKKDLESTIQSLKMKVCMSDPCRTVKILWLAEAERV